MSLRRVACVVLASLGLVAAGAQAGSLSSATWTTELPGLGPNLPLGVPVIATGTSTSSSLSVSLVLPPFTGGFPVTGGPINTYRVLALGGSQMITAAPSTGGATMGIVGKVDVKLALHVVKGANASMFIPGMTTLVRVPLSVGGNGFDTSSFTVSGQFHYLTIDHYAWSPGMQTFTGLTSKLASVPSVMATGSFNLTAMGGGSVLLVSPSRISIDGPLSQRRGVILSTLQLQFVPEPGALLLLGAGGVALLLGRRWS
jgi:hypothetical protein